MKPFYAVDAGEFLVGCIIEQEIPGASLWFPAKDEGSDILMLDRQRLTVCTLQVKVSRDYLVTHMEEFFHPHLESCGWFTPRRSKIVKSASDYWVLGLHSYAKQRLSVLVVPPMELLRRYDLIHGEVERFQSYFWLTKGGKVYETRGLPTEAQRRLAEGRSNVPIAPERDFTVFLNDWDSVRAKLGAEQWPGPHAVTGGRAAD